MGKEYFYLKDDFITLIQFLKATRLAQSGGEAQALVEDGLVRLNGKIEHRKRAKLKEGDTIEFSGKVIEVQRIV